MPKRTTEIDKPKHPGGRPTKYKPEYCLAVEYMAATGMTDVEMSEKLGITEQTFNNWKTQHTEFFESLKRGKEKPDNIVEKSLYARANGYEIEEEKVILAKDNENNMQAVQVIKTKKHIPPDPTSMIFWLKNRLPQKWRDKQVVEHDLPEDTGIIIVKGKMSIEEWQKQQSKTDQ